MKQFVFEKIILELPFRSKAAELITSDYFNSFFPYLTSLDMEIRMGRDLSDLSYSEKLSLYKEFIREQVLEFCVEETEILNACFNEIDKMLKELVLEINPKSICCIKTTGNEEGNMGYTRNNCIIIPAVKFSLDKDRLLAFITHELFHIFSRYNIKSRLEIYSLLGFTSNENIIISKELNSKRITNPDAANFRYSIDLQYTNGVTVTLVPFVYSDRKFDPLAKMKDYIKTAYYPLNSDHSLEIGKEEEITMIKGYYEVQVEKEEANGTENYHHPLYNKIGRNSGYIIHPEEIAADNFSLLLLSAIKTEFRILNDEVGKQLQNDLLRILRKNGETGFTLGDVYEQIVSKGGYFNYPLIIENLASILRGRSEILELCIGDGKVAMGLAEKGFSVTGIDKDQAMLDKITENSGIVTYKDYADVFNLPGKKFDAIYIHSGHLIFNVRNEKDLFLNVPSYKSMNDTFELVSTHLREGGLFIINIERWNECTVRLENGTIYQRIIYDDNNEFGSRLHAFFDRETHRIHTQIVQKQVKVSYAKVEKELKRLGFENFTSQQKEHLNSFFVCTYETNKN